ncbi:unnamed protein product [Lathyrus sativus]|nr:unnamed protein product [Lathyrus sativus]
MRFQSLVLFFFILLAFATMNQAIPVGWSPIKNISDKFVNNIALFAVREYDQQKGVKLEFDKLIKGELQAVGVAGTNYRLTFSAKNGSSYNNYEAVVWVQPENYSWTLTSFKRT